ncbi:MAG: SRPBCC domain-containing protein [Anaerolineaceae bacterium]
MTDSLFLSTIISSEPAVLFRDWLDSHCHSLFTGSLAEINPTVGGVFSAWDGYISGTTLELTPGEKIVQAWRTSEFPSSSPDSLLTITFESAKGGTRISIDHKNIPEGQGEDYKKGWEDFYFSPMKEFYSAGDTPGE